MKKEIDAAIRAMLDEQRKLHEEANRQSIHGLNAFTMWGFEGVHDNLDAGTMATPEDDEFDPERAADDNVLCVSLYETFITEAPTLSEALRLTAMAAFGSERDKDVHTFLRTLNGLEGIQTDEALRAIAKGLQAEFNYPTEGGLVAVFTLHDVLLLASQQFKMQGVDAVHLEVMRTEFVIALPENVDAAVSKVRHALVPVGLKLLSYIFD